MGGDGIGGVIGEDGVVLFSLLLRPSPFRTGSFNVLDLSRVDGRRVKKSRTEFWKGSLKRPPPHLEVINRIQLIETDLVERDSIHSTILLRSGLCTIRIHHLRSWGVIVPVLESNTHLRPVWYP